MKTAAMTGEKTGAIAKIETIKSVDQNNCKVSICVVRSEDVAKVVGVRDQSSEVGRDDSRYKSSSRDFHQVIVQKITTYIFK